MDRRHALMLLSGTAAGLGASLGFGLLPAAACELFPRGGGWRFLVLRHGNVIGEHVFRFSRRDGDFVVEVAIDIAVEMLGITVFRFTTAPRRFGAGAGCIPWFPPPTTTARSGACRPSAATTRCAARSEERRRGKEVVRTCRSRWCQYH